MLNINPFLITIIVSVITTIYCFLKRLNYYNLRQFGIRLAQSELFGIFNVIPLNGLWFVVKEAICADCCNEVHRAEDASILCLMRRRKTKST